MKKNRLCIRHCSAMLTLTAFFCGFFILSGCSSKQEENTAIITAELKPVTKTFYFNGTVKPLEVAHVASPIEGVIEKKNFRYGQTVKEGDLLVSINSSKLEQDYQMALVGYLKARDTLATAKKKFAGTEELMKHELISQMEFDAEKQAFGSSSFDFLQAQLKLEELAKRGMNFNIDQSVTDPKEIEKMLRTDVKIQEIKATKSGVILFPIKTNEESSKEGVGIEVGSQVKQGQVLLTIGDLSGITTEIQVTEMDIHQIKAGQKITVSGPAFPNMQLPGSIRMVGSQAKATMGGAGSPPTFVVEVVIPIVTPEQRKRIHVGMSAKVGLTLEYPSAILLPINAITEKFGEPYVKKIDLKTKKIEEVHVKTGKTTLTDVVVESGVAAGDKIIIQQAEQQHTGMPIDNVMGSRAARP
ncbi:MAG: efflux RND transporter periplasmic adaptor subunit [Gammaproteobacteria bacterium]